MEHDKQTLDADSDKSHAVSLDGDAKPSDKELIDIVKEYRTPPEAYGALRTRYGPGHAVRLKQVAVANGLWKRNKKESPTAPVTSTGPKPDAAPSIVTLQDATLHDSASYASSNSTVGDAEPFEQLKTFINAYSNARRAGLQLEPVQLARMLRLDGIVTLLQGNTPASRTIQTGGTSQGGVASQGDWNILGDVEGMMRMAMKMKMAAPMMQVLSQAMSGSDVAGASEVQQLKKQIEKQEQDKMMDALKREIQSLKENKSQQDPATAATIKTLEFQLQWMKDNQQRDSQADLIKTVVGLTKDQGGTQASMTKDMQQMQNDFNMRIDQQRRDADAKMETLRAAERQAYLDRLAKLETKLDEATRGQTGNPLEVYQGMKGIIKQEVVELDELRGNKGGGDAIPDVLNNLAREFAPVLTAFVSNRGPNQPAAAAGPMMAQSVQTPNQQTVHGRCPWCQQEIDLPAVYGTVSCPRCGRQLNPLQQTDHMDNPQQPPQQMQPQTPQQPPATPLPQLIQDSPSVYDSPIVDGKVVRARRPDEVLLV